MKKLLYITAFPPCQKTGGQQFSLNAIGELAQEYSVDVFYFSYPGHVCELSVTENASECEHGVSSLCDLPVKKFDFVKRFWIHPLFTRRFNTSSLHRIQSAAFNYDILYFDFSQVALYSLYIDHPHKILRMHDVMFQKFGRKNPLLAKWVTATERKLLRSFEKVFVPSKKDAELVRTVYNINALYTNEYLKPVHFPEECVQKKQFVFYGYWRRLENAEGLIWFMRNVFPLLKNTHSFIVIGSGLDFSIQEKFLQPNHVNYLGFVDEPLEIILQSAAVLVPLFQGAGIKVKVIDSFTAGTPVIGTEIAFEGLPEIDGLSFLAKDAKSFAEIIDSFNPFSLEEKEAKAYFFDSIYNNHHLLEQIGGKK